MLVHLRETKAVWRSGAPKSCERPLHVQQRGPNLSKGIPERESKSAKGARLAARECMIDEDAHASLPTRRARPDPPIGQARLPGAMAHRVARSARRETHTALHSARWRSTGPARLKVALRKGRGPDAPRRAACSYRSRAAPGIGARVGLARPPARTSCGRGSLHIVQSRRPLLLSVRPACQQSERGQKIPALSDVLQ